MADDDFIYDDGKLEPTGGAAAAPTLTTTTVVLGAGGSKKQVTVAIDKTAAQELRAIADVHLQKVNVATNAVRSPAKLSKGLPTPLVERTLVGITKNVMTPFTAVTVDGRDMDKFVGYDWLFMKAAAQRDGVKLHINSAFRTPEEQRALITARMNPDGSLTPEGELKGRAGPIDGNNRGAHLMGQALDIGTGMSVAVLRAALIRGTAEENTLREQYTTGNKKQVPARSEAALESVLVAALLRLAMVDYTRLHDALLSPQYRWLVKNAKAYGFTRSVPTEPWHWAHPDAAIMTKDISIAVQDALLADVKTQASTATAMDQTKPTAVQLMDRFVHDTSKAQERSALMARTSRQELFAQTGRRTVFQGAALTSLASRYEAKLAGATLPPPTYKNPSAVTAASYNFETGTWGGDPEGSKV